MATIHTKNVEPKPTSSWPTTANFPMSMVYVMRVDIPRPLGKLSVSLILYQGGSSTTIRLYVTKERKHSFMMQS